LSPAITARTRILAKQYFRRTTAQPKPPVAFTQAGTLERAGEFPFKGDEGATPNDRHSRRQSRLKKRMDEPQQSDRQIYNVHWRRNLFASLIGSFTIIAPMTLLLPFSCRSMSRNWA
jgi:hypothetical protein